MRKKEGDKFSMVLDAATRVFCNVGFDKAQVAAVAAEGGIATGSVYLYFKSKEEILDRLFSRYWLELVPKFRALPSQGSREGLRAQLGLFFDSMANNSELGRVFLKEHHRFLERKPEEGYDAYEECVNMGIKAFQDGVRAGIFPAGMNIPFARSFLFGGVHAALAFVYSNPKCNKTEIRSSLLNMALASLSVLPGAKE